MVKMRGFYALAAASAMTGLVPVAAGAQSLARVSAPSLTVDQLVASIDRAIAALPADATATDLQAAITYTVDQSGASPDVRTAALDQIGTKYKSGSLAACATRTTRLGQLLCRGAASYAARNTRSGTTGTAGLASNGGDFGAGPTVGGGGGGSDYSGRQ